MKRTLLYVVCLMFLAGCQVIKTEDQLIPIEQFDVKRKTLLIEYSGVGCVNCPSAAAEAHRLLEHYPKGLVVVEMHPASNPFTQSKNYDYTCEAADVWYKFFGGIASTSFPTGVIEMQTTADKGSYFVGYQSWGSILLAAMREEPKAELTLTSTKNSDNTYSLSVVQKILSEDYKDIRVIVWLTEDSIVGAQTTPEGADLHYIHSHVLRDEIINEPLSAFSARTEAITYDFSDKQYSIQHCNWVVVLYDEGAKRSIATEQTKFLK